LDQFRLLGLPDEILELPPVFTRPELMSFPNFLKMAEMQAQRSILHNSINKFLKKLQKIQMIPKKHVFRSKTFWKNS
jgi:hypothetical protein